MIARISSGSSFFGAANYNQQKVLKGQGAVLAYDGLLNTHPRTIDQTLKSLNNSRTKKPVFHASLSFSPKDREQLTDEKLINISKAYLEKMGYGKQPFVLYRHDDTEHPHVHILTSSVDVKTGKRIERYKEGIKSKAITEELELQYNLTIADTRKLNQKQNPQFTNDIVRDVSRALQNNRPESVIALNKNLTAMNTDIQLKYHKGGIIYYKVDDNDKRISRSSKSSQFKGTGVTYDKLIQQFEQNKAQRLDLKQVIQQALPSDRQQKVPLFKLTKDLQAKGINPIYYKNDKAIYGIGFNYQGHTYKGSELDRSLSFGNIKERLLIPTVQELQLEKEMELTREKDRGFEMGW